jgi:hypothetical protein
VSSFLGVFLFAFQSQQTLQRTSVALAGRNALNLILQIGVKK